jgi:hypothetical protein
VAKYAAIAGALDERLVGCGQPVSLARLDTAATHSVSSATGLARTETHASLRAMP